MGADRMKRVAGLVALMAFAAPPAAAQGGAIFSPDITADIGTVLPKVVEHEDVAFDDGAGKNYGYLLPTGTIPANVGVEGFETLPNGHILLAFDTTVALAGLVAPAEPRDVVEYDPVTTLFAPFFTGAAAGVPSGVHVDGVSVNPGLDPLLSFDASVTLPGVGPVDDEDVVLYSGGLFLMIFDGSALGVPTSANLDAVRQILGTPKMQISFDTTVTVGGVTANDEDVIEYDGGLGTFSLYFDGSASDPVDWPAADLVAVPEPGGLAGCVSGALLLAGLVRLHDGRRRRLGGRR